MNTKQATPGPWIYTSTDGPTLTIEQLYTGCFIATVASHDEAGKANAQLIASAPALKAENDRLREALKAITATLAQPVQYSESVNATDILRRDCAFALQQARAALKGERE